MSRLIHTIEKGFDRFSNAAVKILGHSITFISAFLLVIYWLLNREFYKENQHDMIRDIITAITFLSFFVIQKFFNRFGLALHLKLNELVASHDRASNTLVNVEHKTESELTEISEKYTELVKMAADTDSILPSHSIDHVADKIEEEEKK